MLFAENSSRGLGVTGWSNRLAEWALVALIIILPFGTRYIFRGGEIGGIAVEWGTASLFASQLLALALLPLAWFGARKKSWRAAWPVAAFSLLLCTSAFFGGAGQLITAWWLVLAAGVMLVVHWLEPRARFVSWSLLASAAVQSAIGVVQFLLQSITASKWLGMASQTAWTSGASVIETADGRWLRAYAAMAHPNVFGAMCMVGLGVAAWLVFSERGRARAIVFALLPLVTAGLVVSFSRSAWVGAFVDAVISLVVAWAHFGRRDSWRIALAFVMTIVLTVTLFTQAVPEIFQTRISATGRLEQGSIDGRVSALDESMALVRENVWLGVGSGRSVYALAEKFPGRSGWSYQPAHVLPIVVLTEIGLLGLVAWAWLLAWPLLTRMRNRGFNGCASPFLGPLAALLAAGFFDHYAWTFWFGACLLCLLAAAAGYSRVEGK